MFLREGQCFGGQLEIEALLKSSDPISRRQLLDRALIGMPGNIGVVWGHVRIYAGDTRQHSTRSQ